MSLQRLLEQTTPGPWESWVDGCYVKVQGVLDGPNVCNFGRDSWPQSNENAVLVALAPDAVRLLADMAAELERIQRLTEREAPRNRRLAPLLARFAALNERADQ